jgi:hypothetical protein
MPGAVSHSCRRTIQGHEAIQEANILGHVAFNKAIIDFGNPSSLDVFHLRSYLLVRTRGLLFTLSINSTCHVAPTRPRANALPAPVTAPPDLAHRTLQYSHSSSPTLNCKPATLNEPECATVPHPYS